MGFMFSKPFPLSACAVVADYGSGRRKIPQWLKSTLFNRKVKLKHFTGERIRMAQPRGVIDTVRIKEIEQFQPNDTDQTGEQHSE